MINLLPQKIKKEIYREYLFRLGVLSLFLFAFFVVVGAIFLSPSLFLVEIKEREAMKQSEIVEKTALLYKNTSDVAAVSSVNKKIAIFSRGEAEGALPGVFRAVLEAKPENISITKISFEKSVDNKVVVKKVLVSGVSLKRDTLVSFLDTLKEDKRFSDATIPTTQLTKSTDISFTITIVLAES